MLSVELVDCKDQSHNSVKQRPALEDGDAQTHLECPHRRSETLKMINTCHLCWLSEVFILPVGILLDLYNFDKQFYYHLKQSLKRPV